MKILELNQVGKTFIERNLWGFTARANPAVQNVSLMLEKGRCLGLVGESGCGKSTLGRIICGLEKPSEGACILNGRVNMVFQDSFSAVNPRYTAAEIVREPIRNFLGLDPDTEKALIAKLLLTVGLHRDDAGKLPHQFSGGQLQRVCLARAIAAKPELLVLDEPTSSLDVSVQAQILNLLADLKREFNLTYVFISHDLEAVYYLADSLAVMYMGSVVEYIEDIALFDQLKHPYTNQLLTSVLTIGNNCKKPSGKDYSNKPSGQTLYEEIGALDQKYNGCKYAPRCPLQAPACLTDPPAVSWISAGHWAACHLIEQFS